MKLFTLSAGTYPFNVLICVGDYDEFKKHLISVGYSEHLVETQMGDHDDNEAITIDLIETYAIWFSKYENTPYYNSIVAHEVFHVTEMIFDSIGIKHSTAHSSEAYAYQIQYFVNLILEELNK